VDNNFSHDSVRLVQDNFMNIKIILNSRNLLFAKRNNVGIRSSSGDYIAPMNNDLLLDPCAFKELIINFQKTMEHLAE
jgi:GT2 family glycosyltransferase